jgi:hypothetical protein
MNTQNLLNERRQEYGQAWYVAGSIMRTFNEVIFTSNLFNHTSYGHNWVLILSKLCRALSSPNNTDHWRDIIGYCQLILDDIDELISLDMV